MSTPNSRYMNLKLKNIDPNFSPLVKALSVVVISLFCFTQNAFSQAITVTEATTNQQVRDYVEDVLLGSCVTVSNITYTGPADASGTFDGAGTILGLDGGIILTTGEGEIAEGPDDDNNAGNDQGNGGDVDLTALAGISTFDAVILEFDFVPQNADLRFNYIFGSEEYPEWVNAGYNDVFGFFISGPGIAGPYTGGAENIALLPSTTIPVAIDNVNNGQSGTEPATGPCTNCAYYVDNSSGPALQYDGYTTVLTAEATVTPCLTYHIKLAVADAGDHIYDSGVFLEEGSFSAGGGVTVDIQTSTIPPGIYEGCNDAWFIFKRVDLSDTSLPITANFTVTGTATPVTDYNAFPSSITIPAGEDSVFINLGVVLDFIPEGAETIIVTMDDPPCTCVAPASAEVTILDNDIPLSVATSGTTTICLGQSTGLTASPAGSQTPYTASWDSGAPAGDNVTVSPTTTTTYTYTVTDNCGGQTVNSSETITVIRPDFTVDDDEQCFDGNNFSFTNTGASGGSVTHFWDFGDSNTSTNENPSHTYASDGSYTVTHSVIFTASNCTADASAIITVFEEPVISLSVDQDVICSGGTDGAISTSVAGGTSAFTYLWTPGGATSSGITGLATGTYSVVVTDANGCTDNGSETIIQNDPVLPTAVCQDITIQLDGAGNATISASDVDNGSSDNCGIASMVVSPNSFDCDDIGGNTATLTVTDVNGNVATCNATVTVEDNVDPTAVCQNVTVQLDASGNASIVAADVDGGSTDNCSVSVTATPLTFTCANVGANTVVLTATDGSSNTDNCNATVTVEDNIDPTAVCQNITVQLDGTGNATISATDVNNGSSDNCSVASLVANPNSFTCANIGANNVTLTVTDVNGNTSTCVAVVTVEDNVSPTASCQNITVQLDGNGDLTIVSADIDGGSSDNCGTPTLTIDGGNPSQDFTCADIGIATVTLTVTDGQGNVSTCDASVTIEDDEDPNAVCQNTTVQLDASGNASIVAADVDGGSNDNCSVSISATPLTFTCANVGANTVVLTATDGSGNTDNCNATVTVEDNVDPDAVCQDITVQLDASGNATISAIDIDNGSSDACGIASMVVNPNAFTCANVGANTVTLTVTDNNGNVSTCNATVTVEDNINPTAVCQDITVQLDASGVLTILSADIDGGSSDNCGIASLSIDGGNTSQSFACSDVGTAVVTLTITDVNGNVSSCDANVTIEDNIDADAVCQDITVQLDANGDLTILAADIDGGSSDNCGATTITIDGGNTSQDFGCSDVGTQTVTLTVTDSNGNVSTCDADVTIEDNIDPTAVCQDITIQLDASGNASISTVDIDNGSVDNCGIASITLDGGVSSLSFDCSDVGTQTITLTVTDVNGNVSTCTADVTIEDNVNPTAVCQDITVQLDANGDLTLLSADIDGGSTDNCGIASVTIDGGNTSQDFGCSDVGVNTITLTVTDVNGNVSTCDADVTIEDNIDPTAVCQDITIQLDASGNASISTVDIDNGSVDNCGIASITLDGGASSLNFDCSDVGTQTVTLTVTDVNGNVSTCTADVTIEDTVDPIAVCQDITVQLDANGDLTLLSADIDGGSTDNCGIASVTIDGGNTSQDFGCSDVGVNTITLTVTDVNGNVSTCDADVTIEDNIDPTAVCQDITIQLDASGNASISTVDIDNGSVDNCGIASITLDGGASTLNFDCSDVGTQTVTLTVTDVNGNVSTCTADVTIEDNVDPSAVCQDITVQLDASGNATITGVDIDNGSADNCGIASLDAGPNSFDCSNIGVNTVTLTVTDDNGNVTTCTADVTIEDNVNPDAVCQDITIQLDANGDATIVAADVDGGSSDNCAIASMTVSPNVFDCNNLGTNLVVLTVTDVNGNVSTCTATVTVEDNVPPTPICQDIIAELDPTGNVVVAPGDVDNGSFDNCAIVSITLDPNTFVCADIGLNAVTLTVTDVAGNVSTCTANVDVQDNVLPSALCQDITVQLDAAGNALITPVMVDNGSTDACGSVTPTLVSPANFDCSNVGINIVTLTVEDQNGNISTCESTVTIEDNINPDAVCQDITVQLDATGNVSITPADVDGGSSDNCAIDFMTVDPNSFTCAEEGANTVMLTVTDVNGNVSTCTATVTVENTVIPTVSCQDITIYLDAAGTASIVAADVDGRSNAACGIASLTVDPSTFDCSNVGPNTVTLTGTDNSGNVSTCTATVTVVDNIPPTAICQNITVQLDASGNASIVAADVDGGSTDNCAIASLSATPTTFDCNDVGSNSVVLTVTDVNGNNSTCTAIVTIEDDVNPTIVCQDISVELDATGNVSITSIDIDNGSTDNCSSIGDGLTLSLSETDFDCTDLNAVTVTLTATDENGNASTCTATVTILDNDAPTALCQDITVYLDAAGNASIVPADIDNGSFDNCSIVDLVVTPNTFTCAGVGPNPVSLTATDQSGNVATCSATVTVIDTISPTAVCQDITVQLDGAGNASIVATQINNGSSDICGIASLVLDQTSFDCSEVGANTVALTVTDLNGNVSTCSSSVELEDNVDPIAVCQDITVQLDASGNATIVAGDIDDGSSDNCAVASIAADITSFDCSNVGTNIVTLTVTDVNGNVSTCTSTVTIEDNVPPTPVCQDITVQLDALGTAIITASQIDNGSSDNCAVATLAIDQTSFDCSEVGSNTVTLTVTDVNGNVSTCTSTVTVEDNVNPNAVCQDITVQLDASGNASIVAADVDGGSTDNCAIASLSVDPSTFDCDDIGANTVTLTVTDVNGNVSTCTANVTVEDNINPTIVCQDITVQLDATGNVSIVGADIDGGTTDNCSQIGLDITLSATPGDFDCDDVGSNTVTLTATDAYGNSSTCTADVTVEDNVPPIAVCQDITVQLDATGNVSIVAADVDGGSSDNCAIDNLAVSQEDFVCAEVGGNSVTLTVTDVNGNVSTCTATVTVEDNVPPIALCQDITIQLDASGNASIVAADVDNGSSDNCGISSLTVNPSSFTCAEEGTNTVTLTVTDVNGNVSTCTSIVTVENNVTPNVFCQDITVYLDGTGNIGIIADDVNGGSNASCGLASLTVSPDAFDCSNIGPNTVTLTAVDNSGNTSSCTATVTVLDTVSPDAVCQDITVQLDAAGNASIVAADVDGGSTDNCAIASLAVSPNTFDCSNVGANTVTLTVTDVNGNISTCTSTVTVEDNVAPIAVCQDIPVQLDASGNVSITASQVDNGSSDACGIASLAVDPSTFDCSNVGGNTVTLTVTDVNGNASTCTATVTVMDNEAPIAVCQDITIQLDASGNANIVPGDIDDGSTDNCAILSMSVTPNSFTCAGVGANPVTLTVTDVNGNISTCNATVTVEDNIPPVALCQDITVQLDANGDASIVASQVNAGSSDACGIASLSVDPSTFDCSNVAGNTVTLTVTDVNGNVSSCTSTVTVEDNVAPTAVCQDITVQLDASGNASIVSSDVDGGSTDNCAVANLSVTPNTFDCSNVGGNIVTLTVTDVNGNSSTCTADVVVEDNVAPIALCQDVTVQLDAAGNASIVAADIDNGSNDNCAIASLDVSPNTFDCSNVGGNTVTLTVTDVNGNVSTCTATVTVEDNVNPNAVCQDITVQLDAAGNATIVAADVDGGSTDNCAIASLAVDPSTFDCSNIGANTATLTVTDVNGNVSTCTANITVEDNVDPVVICQDITVQVDANGDVNITGADIDGGTSDNCDQNGLNITFDVTPSAFDCNNVGVNTVTLTATDAYGNTSTCTADVTVEDNIPPVAVCQDITVQLDATGNVSIVAADVDGGSSDNCAIDNLAVSQEDFVCAEVGANTVTLTVTDVNGNVSTCDATVTVEDIVPPIALCQDITIQLDATGNATIAATDIDNGSSDNCAIASMVVDPNAFTCAEEGPNTVTLTVTDVNGNVSTCTATVTVENNVAPNVFCQDITVYLDATGNVGIIADDVNGGSNASCGLASLTVTPDAFDCSNIGPNMVTLTAVDNSGNSSTCTAVVTVLDTINPIAVCQDITVQLDANGEVTINSIDIDGGSTDNCGVATLMVDVGQTSTSFDCSDVGVNTVTLTVTDVNGNLSTCDAEVTVEDNIDPTAVCQDITVQLSSAGVISINSVDIDGGSTDNCGIASVTVDGGSSNMNFDCTQVGDNTITLTVTDVNGNVSTCDAVVTVEDTINPTAICQDITIQLDANGEVTINSINIDGGSLDNCGIASITVDGGNSTLDFDCSQVGTNTVTLTVTDVNGNVSTCDATVTVEDTVDPTAVCQDITIQLDANGEATINSIDIDGGSFDNCGIASITVDGGNSTLDFDCSQVGVNTVTLTVTDVNGNISTCDAEVTVEDNINPTALCQDITVQLDATGTAILTAANIDGGSSDNCGIDSLSIHSDDVDWDCIDVGVHTVTLTVTDVNGNVSTCDAQLTVENNQVPTLSCTDINVYLDASGNTSIVPGDVNAGASASCGLASITVTPDAFDCSNIGPNTVTLTATDSTGNVTTCTAIVTVLDTISPTAVCQDITVQLDANGDLTITSADIDGGSSDNCGVASVTVDNGQLDLDFDCSSVGINTVTLTVTDVNGNVSTCDAEVTVEDNVNPTALCQDITVQLDPNGEIVITSVDIDGGSTDNCTVASLDIAPNSFDCTNYGTNAVVLTVTDNNGNVSTCIATVTVADTIAPTAICTDITVQLDANGTATIAAGDVDNGSFDNCAIQSLEIDVDSFDCSMVGPNTVTLTVTDVNGNVSTCTSTATVEDNVDPLLSCQDITVQLDENGNVSITAIDVDNGSTDACGIDNMSVDVTDFDCSNVGVNQVTLTVTDVNGNFDICQAAVTVLDTVPPTAVCQDITIQLDASGSATIVAVDVDGGSSDNCAIDAIAIDENTFDCTQVGDNTVTLTVVDVNGNTSTCESTVTVEDNVNPNANCDDITIYLDANGAASIDASDINAGSDANCGLDTVFVNPSTFTCAEVGNNTVTLTVVDNNGNISTCTANVEVLDTISPTALCQDLVIQLDDNGQTGFTIPQIDNGSFDNCAIAGLAVDQTTFDCSEVGDNTVTLTVTDVNGNISSCTSIITVQDTVAPIANCSAFVVQLDSIGQAVITTDDIDLNSSDNCAVASLALDQENFDCSEVGSNTVTLTVTDVNGNVSTCTSTVIVEDNVPPISLCQDITIYLDASGQVSIIPADVDAGSTDNCAIDTMYVTPNDFSCSGVGANPVTLTVTDVNQNTSSCISTVTVLDTISPIAVCQDITIQLDSLGNASIDPQEIDNGSNDACGILDFSVDVSTFNCATVASNTVVLTVEDNNGNTSTCTAEVIIEDNVAPEAVCQDAILYLDSIGQVFIASTDVDGGSTDNCVIDTVFLAQNNFSCDDLGTNLIELTVVDVNGNSDICTAEITVLDTIVPYWVGCPIDTIIVPDSSDCSPSVVWTQPTPFDNCTYDVVRSHAPGQSFPVGTTTVTYTVTDLSGNSALCMFDVTIEPSPVLVSITPQEGPCGYNLSCSGAADGEATANPAGGCLPYTYLWSDPLAQTSQTAVGLGAGSYAVTVTDANGTTATETIVITEPDVLSTDSITSPEFNGGANISCNGEFDGAVNINVLGGSECIAYDFAWTGPNGFTSTSQDLTDLEAGTYVVTVSDASGCSYMDSITLVEPEPLDADSLLSDYNGNNVSCAGAADGSIDLTVSGGATPYTFTWSNGATTEDVDSLTAGTYTYVIVDANGCEFSGSITLTEPVGLSTSITTSDYNGYHISCFGSTDGSIDLSVFDGTAPYSYVWNNGETTQDLEDLPTGSYLVEVTDDNGCTTQDSIILREPLDIVILPTDTTIISCNGQEDGSFTVLATGGVPTYTYQWSNGQTGPTAQDLGAGTYMVTATDINGCQDSILMLLTEPFELEAYVVQVQDAVCNGQDNGIIDVNVIGGTAPYAYDWSNSATDQDLNGVAAGTYFLDVTDANGCLDTLTVIINEPELLIMTVDTVIDATCSGAANGEITVEGSGGTAPYTYFWPDLSVSGPTATGLEAGVYEVQVTDDNGCAWSLNVVVGQPSSIDATVSVVTEVSCNGLEDAEALVTVNGGTAPYSYLWSNADADSLAQDLGAGTYSVTVTDAAGCDTTLSVIVTEPTLIVIDIDTIYNVTCNGFVNGQIEVDVSGGTIPYDLSWSNGDVGYIANNLEAGTHTVYVSDANGCLDSLSASITEPDTLELLQVVTTNSTCFGGADGEATVLVEGGTAPYTYSWPSVSQTGNTATNLEAGEYVFVALDANNCVFSDTVQITEPEEVIVTITPDTAVCPGNGVTITASADGGAGNYSYSWDNGLGLGASHFVSPSVATTYSVEVVDQAGCAANIASVTVDISAVPVADFTSAADAPCVLPTTINYTNTSTGASTFEWLLGNGTTSADENPSASYDLAGDYTVTLVAISDAGCSDTTTQVVNIDDVPTADFTIDNAQGCAPLAVNFGNGSGTGLEYTWDFGDGSTSSAPNPTHWYEIPGDYEVSLIVSAIGGCTDTLALGAAVSVYASPIADFTPVQVIIPEPGREYNFINNTVGADLYNWDFGNGEQTDEYEPFYEYPNYGGYFVTLTAISENGCADTAVHYINVELNTSLFAPNALGIGQAGEVGVFIPKGTGVQDYHLWIFDNWGNMIWESTALNNGSPAEGWDGQYKGQYVPQGSYVWKIDATFIDGTVWEGQEHGNGSTSNTGSVMVLY